MTAKKQTSELPKYMTLEAGTQYELAQSIDQALAQAEKAALLNDEQACLHLWLQQIVDHFQDEFGLELDEPMLLHDFDMFKKRVAGLVTICLQQETDQQRGDSLGRIKQCLEYSFQGALDLMRTQSLWRFDLQRQMQERQEALLREAQRTP